MWEIEIDRNLLNRIMEHIENCFHKEIHRLKGKARILAGRFYLSQPQGCDQPDPPSVHLELCDGCLIISYNQTKSRAGIPYSEDLKFQMLFSDESNVKSQMIGFKIVNKGSEVSFFLEDQLVVRKWWNHLISRVTYRGMDSLFKRSIKIGQGAFSSVYLATFQFDDRRMALKCVEKDKLNKDNLRKQSFFSEVEVMRRLNHENISKLYGVFESEEAIYQAMELIDCGQLAYRFKSNYKFSSFEIKHIMESVLKGLRHIHSKGIMHRDIKPENIMFRTKSTDSEIVIVDFGLAVFCDASDYIWYRCGTPGYIAPEILANKRMKKLDPVVDIFSVGAIFYRMLFGKPLFPGKSHNQVLAMNTACEFQFVEIELVDNFTTATLDLLMKMLDLNPVTRITAQEALTHPFFQENNIFKSQLACFVSPQQDSVIESGSYSPIMKNSSPIKRPHSIQRFQKYRRKLLESKNYSPRKSQPPAIHN